MNSKERAATACRSESVDSAAARQAHAKQSIIQLVNQSKIQLVNQSSLLPKTATVVPETPEMCPFLREKGAILYEVSDAPVLHVLRKGEKNIKKGGGRKTDCYYF